MLFVEHTETNLPDLQGLEKDTVVLNWEERRKCRQKVRTEKGTELVMALPTGTILRDGEILYANEHGYITVEAAQEQVLVVDAGNIAAGARVAYEVGNRHLPISINGSRIVILRDAHLEEFFLKNGIPYRLEKAAFEPVKKVQVHG